MPQSLSANLREQMQDTFGAVALTATKHQEDDRHLINETLPMPEKPIVDPGKSNRPARSDHGHSSLLRIPLVANQILDNTQTGVWINFAAPFTNIVIDPVLPTLYLIRYSLGIFTDPSPLNLITRVSYAYDSDPVGVNTVPNTLARWESNDTTNEVHGILAEGYLNVPVGKSTLRLDVQYQRWPGSALNGVQLLSPVSFYESNLIIETRDRYGNE